MMAKKRAKKEAEALADAKVKAKLDSIREKARDKAFDELEPALIDKMKEEEMRKMTGEAKKDKLKKFGDAFKLDGFDTNDKLGRMLGGSGNQGNQGGDRLGMGSYGGMSNDQIAGAMGGSMRGLPRNNDDIVDGIGQGRKTISNREIEEKMTWHEGKNSSKIIDVTPVEIYEPKKKKKPVEYKSEGDLANERLSRMLGK
jgi:hypothetical protein